VTTEQRQILFRADQRRVVEVFILGNVGQIAGVVFWGVDQQKLQLVARAPSCVVVLRMTSVTSGVPMSS
jgi:hypothetical protein